MGLSGWLGALFGRLENWAQTRKRERELTSSQSNSQLVLCLSLPFKNSSHIWDGRATETERRMDDKRRLHCKLAVYSLTPSWVELLTML